MCECRLDECRRLKYNAMDNQLVEVVQSDIKQEDLVKPSPSLRSEVWKHFNFHKHMKGKTICMVNNCHAVLSYTTGSTSAMQKHLDKNHGIIKTKVQVDVSICS